MREGRQAGGPAGKARARTAGGTDGSGRSVALTAGTGKVGRYWESRRRQKGHRPRPSAGDQTARAQAQARAPTRASRWRLACMRATQCGTHQGHTMSKRTNGQVGGR